MRTLVHIILQPCAISRFGVNDIQFENEAEAKLFFKHLTDFYNSIIADLLDRTYDPLLMDEDEDEGDLEMSAKIWIRGYIVGLSLDGVEWFEQLPEETFFVLMMVVSFSFSKEEAAEKLKDLFEDDANASDENLTELLEQVPDFLPAVAADIYEFQKNKRSYGQVKYSSDSDCSEHTDHRVGRNEPCPCGSGKKYKKCCLL